MGLSRTDSIPVGQQVRDLRRAKGMRIAGLASEIGRSVGFVSQVERGLSPVTIPDLKKIADALGVEINWFFQGQAMAPPEERDIIVRRANRRELNYSGTGVQEALLSPHLHGAFEMVMTTLEPGAALYWKANSIWKWMAGDTVWLPVTVSVLRAADHIVAPIPAAR